MLLELRAIRATQSAHGTKIGEVVERTEKLVLIVAGDPLGENGKRKGLRQLVGELLDWKKAHDDKHANDDGDDESSDREAARDRRELRKTAIQVGLWVAAAIAGSWLGKAPPSLPGIGP